MITRLRRRHRWTVTALAIVVPVVFAWAMLARRTVPRVDHVPVMEHGAHAESP